MALNGIGKISHLKGPDAEELILCFSSRSVEAALAGLDDYWDRFIFNYYFFNKFVKTRSISNRINFFIKFFS